MPTRQWAELPNQQAAACENLLVRGSLEIPDSGSIVIGPGRSLSVSVGAGSAVDVSTEGTRDWFAPGGTAAGYDHRAGNGIATNSPAPIGNGSTMRNFLWAAAGNAMTPFVQASGMLITSNANNTVGQAALNSNQFNGYFQAGAGVGWGFFFITPAVPDEERICRIRYGQFSNVIQWRAQMYEGVLAAGLDVAVDVDSGAGVGIERMTTIRYRGSSFGTSLLVSGLCTVNRGASPNLRLGAITIAPA